MACWSLVAHVLLTVAVRPSAADDAPDWDTTIKWLKVYFADEPLIAHRFFDSDRNRSITLRFTYFSLDPQTRPVDHLVVLDLQRLDPGALTVKAERGPERTIYVLTLRGEVGCKAVECRSLPEDLRKKSFVDEEKDYSFRADSRTILFLSEENANKAMRAFRRAAILAGAKESKDPFK